jgi:type II secretory pathway component PulM
MAKDNSAQDWDTLWTDYNKSLKRWLQAFESLQKASSEVQAKYNEVMTKALGGSSQNTVSQFMENWQNAMSQAGVNALKQFGENWQTMISQSSFDQLKTYGEMMNKFAETWAKMYNMPK